MVNVGLRCFRGLLRVYGQEVELDGEMVKAIYSNPAAGISPFTSEVEMSEPTLLLYESAMPEDLEHGASVVLDEDNEFVVHGITTTDGITELRLIRDE